MELWSIAVTGFLFCVFVVLYFLPTLVAVRRKHPQTLAIFVLNLLMGVTVIGWVAAFIWSCIAQAGPVVVTDQMPMPPPRRNEPEKPAADKELPAWLRQ